MKSAEESMEILEAFDLTRSLRGAAELAGCSHNTVARLVAERDAGGVKPARVARTLVIAEFLPKIEQWVEDSHGNIRADVAHEKLTSMGFTGSQRTSRRAVAQVKANYVAGRRRVHRPWVTEPGLWLQYDFGDGPVVDGVKTVLFCAWLAWSRFRIVIALRDRTIPTVFRGAGCHVPAAGRRTNLCADRQREVGDHRACRPHPGPQPAGRRVRSALRHHGAHLPTAGPGIQGRGGERGETGQGRHRPHRDQPRRTVRVVRCAATGVHGIHGQGQRPGAHGDQAGPDRHADDRAGAAASDPRSCAHHHLWRNPAGRGEHPDGVLPGRFLLGAAPAARRDGVGADARRRRRRAGRHRACRPVRASRGRPARPGRAGQPADRRRPLPGPAGRGVAPGTQGEQCFRSGIPGAR